jgi:hypothetical protein
VEREDVRVALDEAQGAAVERIVRLHEHEQTVAPMHASALLAVSLRITRNRSQTFGRCVSRTVQ